MKKFIISFLVVATFSAYVVYARMVGSGSAFAPETAVGQKNTTTGTPSIFSNINVPVVTPTTTPTNTTPTPVASNTNTTVVPPTPAPTNNTPAPTPVVPVALPPKPKGQYKDGSYTGVSADAYYGNIQVQTVIQGGKIVDVVFLDYPQDRTTSRYINSQAMPMLKQEAIQAQSANVDTISGATDSSGAFVQSLTSALAQAKN